MRASHVTLAALVLVSLGTTATRPASAVSIIRDPNPPRYKVEIEPHLNVQWFGLDYDANGIGPGVRFSIPVMSPGFIKKINDSVAISFGADALWYRHQGCWWDNGQRRCWGDDRTFWVLYAPVTLQWNFWLTDSWSVFGEPGLVLRAGFGDACDYDWCGGRYSPIWFAFYAGARYHFNDDLALTLRLGYPTGLSVGLSIF